MLMCLTTLETPFKRIAACIVACMPARALGESMNAFVSLKHSSGHARIDFQAAVYNIYDDHEFIVS